jgi:hypothetical protein
LAKLRSLGMLVSGIIQDELWANISAQFGVEVVDSPWNSEYKLAIALLF